MVYALKYDIRNNDRIKYIDIFKVQNSNEKGDILQFSARCCHSNVARKNSKAWNLNLLPWNFYGMPWKISFLGANFRDVAVIYAHKWCICKITSLFARRGCIIMQRVTGVYLSRGEEKREQTILAKIFGGCTKSRAEVFTSGYSYANAWECNACSVTYGV